MARIKFLQEDFAGFRPDRQVATPVRRPDQILTPLQAIQTVRAGVELGREVAGTAVDAADYLTKAGIIGRQPTKEELMEEAAKKKAGEVAKQREQQLQQLKQQEEERAKAAEGLQTVSPEETKARQSALGMLKEKRQVFENEVARFVSGEQRPEYFLNTLERANNEGLISEKEYNQLKDKAYKARGLLQQRTKELVAPLEEQVGLSEEQQLLQLDKQEADLFRQEGREIPQDLQDRIAIREKTIERMVSAPRTQLERMGRTRTLEDQLKLEQQFGIEQEIGKPQLERNFEEQRQTVLQDKKLTADEAKKKLSSIDQAEANAILSTLSDDQKLEIYSKLIVVPSMERTKEESIILNELRALGFKEPVTAGPQMLFKEQREETQQFLANAEKRKEEIRKNVELTAAEKREQIAAIDERIAAAEQKETTGVDRTGMKFERALTAIDELNAQTGKPKTSDELKKDKARLEQALAGSQKELQLLEAQEGARTDAIKRAGLSYLEAAAELQSLNQTRLQKGGSTPDEARRIVQLKEFLTQNAELQKKLMGADVSTDKNISEMVIQLDRMVKEGKAPLPETQQQRDARFNEQLKMFDKETADNIKAATEAAKAEVANTVIDADQLKMLAVMSALNDDEKLAEKVLAMMSTGKVVGMQPQSFSDFMSGDYKKRYNNEIFNILFQRTKGKSDKELALLQQNLGLKQYEKLAQIESRLAGVEKTSQQVREATAKEEAKVATAKSEAQIKEAKATREKFKAGEEYLNKEMEKLQAQATKLAIEAGVWGKYYDSKIKLNNAQAGFAAGRNSTAIKIAGMGSVKDGVKEMGDNLDGQARASDAADKMDREEVSKYSGYSAYFGSDGKPNDKFNEEFPPASNKAAYNAAVDRNGGGIRGKEILEKRRKEALLYADKVKSPTSGFMTPERQQMRQAGRAKFASAMRELKSTLDSSVLDRTQPSVAEKKMRYITDANTKINEINAKIARGEATQADLDKIDTIVQETKAKVAAE